MPYLSSHVQTSCFHSERLILQCKDVYIINAIFFYSEQLDNDRRAAETTFTKKFYRYSLLLILSDVLIYFIFPAIVIGPAFQQNIFPKFRSYNVLYLRGHKCYSVKGAVTSRYFFAVLPFIIFLRALSSNM